MGLGICIHLMLNYMYVEYIILSIIRSILKSISFHSFFNLNWEIHFHSNNYFKTVFILQMLHKNSKNHRFLLQTPLQKVKSSKLMKKFSSLVAKKNHLKRWHFAVNFLPSVLNSTSYSVTREWSKIDKLMEQNSPKRNLGIRRLGWNEVWMIETVECF